MALIQWSDDLSVKINSIDDQHKKLIQLINDFYDNIKNSSSNEHTLKLIGGMKKYTIEHFCNEERMMKIHGYPEYEGHKKEHEKFIAKVNTIEEKINAGQIVISIEVTAFLKDWLKNHIQGIDKKYSNFFMEKGIH